MRLRSSAGETDPSTRESPPDASDSSSSATPVRTFLLVAVGAAAVAYVVSRLRPSSGKEGDAVAGVDAPFETIRRRTASAVPDEVGERVAEAVPAEPQSIPIGGSDSAERGADTGGESAARGSDPTGADTDDAHADAGEPIEDEEMNAELADEPSSTKINTGTSDEIQEKPAEPGEMAVDESVEDMVDDEVGEPEAGDESDVDEE